VRASLPKQQAQRAEAQRGEMRRLPIPKQHAGFPSCALHCAPPPLHKTWVAPTHKIAKQNNGTLAVESGGAGPKEGPLEV
jgi:hypothetical protein